MKQQIIITGGSGLVGSRIQELLSGKFMFINWGLDTGVDITNRQLLEKKFKESPKVEIVLHLAAFTDVNGAFIQDGDKNGSCYKVNVLGSKNIAQLCKKYHKHLIHISTDYVFDGHNPAYGGYTEKSLPHPIEWYGKTKLWAEQEIKKSKCQFTILRIAFPYKAKVSNNKLEPIIKLDLVRNIIKKLKVKEKISMFGDQKITPTFIDDISKVIEKTIELKTKLNGLFHCVGSESLSPYDLAIKIADIFSFNKAFIQKESFKNYLKNNPTARPRPNNLTLSNKKLKQKLGIKMLTVDQGLKKIKEDLA